MTFTPPLGATYNFHGNETLFAIATGVEATAVDLALLNSPEHTRPSKIISLTNRVQPRWTEGKGIVWYTTVPNIPVGQLYAFRVDGPFEPRFGRRYNPNKWAFDPFADAVGRRLRWSDCLNGHEGADDTRMSQQSNILCCPLASVVDHKEYDWEGDVSPNVPWTKSVFYELHVKGFTAKDRSVDRKIRGTYSGMMQKIDYLKRLGVTAVELMPISSSAPGTHERSVYWRYDLFGHCAPDPDYSAYQLGEARITELKDLIKAFHRAGIEVILDIVFNHTVEGNQFGPSISYRLIGNGEYYRLCGNEHDGPYRFYRQGRTGCGNELRIEGPLTRSMVLTCLRRWHQNYHVDGFRFDLASVLTLIGDECRSDSPFLEEISRDPVLSSLKLIAEPWDAGGYFLGGFGRPWGEWNDRYRGNVRDIWRGRPGQMPLFRSSLLGSKDIFPIEPRGAARSINFVTCHDGFTLRDLVSYEGKHNEANGEGNCDGSDDNRSCNYGVEGPTDDPEINRLRDRQMRNMLVTLLASRGTPMILGGDEIRRTQRGNNNAYCQDNDVTWYDWDNPNLDFQRFTRAMIAMRGRYPALRCCAALKEELGTDSLEEIAERFSLTLPKDLPRTLWFGPGGRELTDEELANPELRAIGLLHVTPEVTPRETRLVELFLLFNTSATETVPFALPTTEGMTSPFERILDTSDVARPFGRVRLNDHTYSLPPRTVVFVRRRL